jgi:hypothetical protein
MGMRPFQAACCAALLVAFALTACATASSSEFSHLRGCWIERKTNGEAATMRWFQARDDLWNGDFILYAKAGQLSGRFTLERRAEGWVYCGLPATNEGEAQMACQPVGSIVKLKATDEHLTISDARRLTPIVFDGKRDGCD